MQQLTKLRKSFLRWEVPQPPTAKTQDETIVQHDGVNYKILPLDKFNELINRWSLSDAFFFALGAGLVAFCAGFTLAPQRQPTVVEKIVTVDKPIVIEKPTPVNSGCLAFCNR
ncbi:MAG: hypothetical protein RLZZ511_1935 [Cyanobacteriota bacterium]|jgi:hypothetical protein